MSWFRLSNIRRRYRYSGNSLQIPNGSHESQRNKTEKQERHHLYVDSFKYVKGRRSGTSAKEETEHDLLGQQRTRHPRGEFIALSKLLENLVFIDFRHSTAD